jgi:DNA-binding NtrC family response regulator
MSKDTVLIIDDDESVLASLALLLKQGGYRAATAAGPSAAVEFLRRCEVALVLQDMNFSRETTGDEGLALLSRIRELRPGVPVILMTAWGSIELAVQGMKNGAADFVTKPWNNAQVLQSVRTALGLSASGREARAAGAVTRGALDRRYDFTGVYGENRRFLEVLELLGRVSATDASILVTGESGTGKEVAAEAVHRNSPRRSGPFVRVNLGGIPAALFESEMFGHVRGAFTDAHRDRKGRFALAEGGTILLDEVGEIDAACQVKLLRVLQDRTYEVLGSSETRPTNVRVIASTNRNLKEAVGSGDFREDLYYRLNLITVRLPSLAERRDDIPILARHFLEEAARSFGVTSRALSDGALAWLESWDWPGNVRQLKQVVARTVLVTDAEVLTPEHFRKTVEMELGSAGRDAAPHAQVLSLEDLEKAAVTRALRDSGGNVTRAAESLGLSRAALYRRIEKHGIPQ